MPGLDRTGPGGQGSQTGRRQGRCSSPNRNVKQTTDSLDFERTGRGRGFRQGGGKDFGSLHGNGFSDNAGRGRGRRRGSNGNNQ